SVGSLVTRVFGFVPVERSLRPRVGLFAPLRDKGHLVGTVTGSSGRPSQGSRPSILTEPHDELASFHSITSSARASNVGGMAIPTALAVLRLMISSNLVGWTIASSPGCSRPPALGRRRSERSVQRGG